MEQEIDYVIESGRTQEECENSDGGLSCKTYEEALRFFNSYCRTEKFVNLVKLDENGNFEVLKSNYRK